MKAYLKLNQNIHQKYKNRHFQQPVSIPCFPAFLYAGRVLQGHSPRGPVLTATNLWRRLRPPTSNCKGLSRRRITTCEGRQVGQWPFVLEGGWFFIIFIAFFKDLLTSLIIFVLKMNLTCFDWNILLTVPAGLRLWLGSSLGNDLYGK